MQKQSDLLSQVLETYTRLETIYHKNKEWIEMSENELWQELCLCILSSNVPYELALSAVQHLRKKGFLSLQWIANSPDSDKVIANELSRPIYFPKKINGGLRRYRFPNIRAKNIFQSAKVISSKKFWILELLRTSNSEIEVRNLLVSHISGIGLKEASHFLRNIKYSKNLAIIDSHVVKFLEKIYDDKRIKTKTLTQTTYLELENRILDICNNLRVNPSIFDMAIWHFMRRA